MNPLRRLAALLLVAIVLGAASGCAQKIQRVLADPSRYRDREVTIAGEVLDSYSVVGRGAYRVDDRTGSLWVVSEHGVPRKGAYVKTTGTVREGFDLGALGNLIKMPNGVVILVEREHRVR